MRVSVWTTTLATLAARAVRSVRSVRSARAVSFAFAWPWRATLVRRSQAHAHFQHAGLQHAELARAFLGHVDDALLHEGPSIVHATGRAAAAAGGRHLEDGAEGVRSMRARAQVRLVALPVRGLVPGERVRVVRRQPA